MGGSFRRHRHGLGVAKIERDHEGLPGPPERRLPKQTGTVGSKTGAVVVLGKTKCQSRSKPCAVWTGRVIFDPNRYLNPPAADILRGSGGLALKVVRANLKFALQGLLNAIREWTSQSQVPPYANDPTPEGVVAFDIQSNQVKGDAERIKEKFRSSLEEGGASENLVGEALRLYQAIQRLALSPSPHRGSSKRDTKRTSLRSTEPILLGLFEENPALFRLKVGSPPKRRNRKEGKTPIQKKDSCSLRTGQREDVGRSRNGGKQTQLSRWWKTYWTTRSIL